MIGKSGLYISVSLGLRPSMHLQKEEKDFCECREGLGPRLLYCQSLVYNGHKHDRNRNEHIFFFHLRDIVQENNLYTVKKVS